MENTKTNTQTQKDDVMPCPTLAEVLNTGDMDIPPRSERNNDTPFANLAQKAIENACKRDREFQDSICRQHNKAHEITKAYYLGMLTFAEAVNRLITECHRSRECAMLNIQNSQYRRIYTAQKRRYDTIAQHVFNK